MGDWEELNKETYVCNVCLQNNFKVDFCMQMLCLDYSNLQDKKYK